MDRNGIDPILDLLFIKCTHTQFLADESFGPLFQNGGELLTELLSMFHTAGTAPDDFTGKSGNAPVVMIAFHTNQKATQYTLGVVLGNPSLE